MQSSDSAMNAFVSCGFLAVFINQKESSYNSIRVVRAVKVKNAWAHAYSVGILYAVHKYLCFFKVKF